MTRRATHRCQDAGNRGGWMQGVRRLRLRRTLAIPRLRFELRMGARRWFGHRAGLTLLELLAVLVILAIATTVAVTATDGLIEQSRYEATQETLRSVHAAVVGDAHVRQPDGSLMITGFVADLGRLPRAVLEDLDGDGVAELALSELWRRPAGVEAFGVKQATDVYVEPPTLADPAVYVACGWRGPYVRLPIGATDLRDGWGEPPELLDVEDDPIVAAGDLIAQVRSVGGLGYGGDLRAVFRRAATGEDYVGALVTGEVRRWDAATGSYRYPKQSDGDVRIVLFGPNPANGRIAARAVTIPATALSDDGSAPVTYTFADLTIGPRVLRAYQGGRASEILRIVVVGGGQTVGDLHL